MQIGRDANGIKSLNRHTLEQIIAASAAAFVVVDARNPGLPIVYASPAYERESGFATADLAGHPWALLGLDSADDAELARLKVAIGRGEACRVTVPDLRKDGTSWRAEIDVTPLHDPRGELKYFLCSHQAVRSPAGADSESAAPLGELSLLQRELGRARQKIATMDRIDPATGLMRFGYFQETLRRDFTIARRERRFVTLLVFEVMEFDVYRQTFGDKAADSCQRMIGAQIMRTLRRAGDLCARYDESTLVAAVVGQEASEIQPLADQIAENVRQLKLHNPRAKASRYITMRATLITCRVQLDRA